MFYIVLYDSEFLPRQGGDVWLRTVRDPFKLALECMARRGLVLDWEAPSEAYGFD